MIGELWTKSKFVSSTYGAKRLLGTHQPFEEDLHYRPDWVPYSSPLYLSRAGSVGVYSQLFPIPNVDVIRAEMNLMLLMNGIIRGLTSAAPFKRFLDQLGESSGWHETTCVIVSSHLAVSCECSFSFHQGSVQLSCIDRQLHILLTMFSLCGWVLTRRRRYHLHSRSAEPGQRTQSEILPCTLFVLGFIHP